MAGMNRRIKLGGGLAALLLAAAPPAAAADRDTLTIGVQTYPPTLNPLIDPTAAKSYVLGLVVRPLTAYAAVGQPFCVVSTGLRWGETGPGVHSRLMGCQSAS
jgi:hypothetical protein